MTNKLSFRIAVSLVILITAAAYALPFFSSVENSSFIQYFPSNRINLGLDLKGGMHLTLGVGVDKAIENSLLQNGRELIVLARKEKIVVQKPKLLPDGSLEFTLLNQDTKNTLSELLTKYFPTIEVVSSSVVGDGKSLRYVVKFSDAERGRLADLTLDQALKTIRNRIDEFGVSEPDIRKFAESQRIQIQLPGLEDPARAVELIGRTAALEFRLVASPTDSGLGATEVLPYATSRGENQKQGETVTVYKDTLLSGKSVADARQGFDTRPGGNNAPLVEISFDASGATLFEHITTEYKGHYLAIVLDDKVYSVARINEPIKGGKAQISGSFSVPEATDLALVLRAGSLPAPVTILEERNVGPSLGQDSIDKGLQATILGFVLVVVFMTVYYRASGLIANLMLCLDLILLLAGMAIFGATLTLPGIAGIVLTLGMAVDANVLIFERIREELNLGKSSLEAVKEGFSKASVTIIDSNLTTIIAAVILYQFGTGPIRGFAVTLCIGILASMFTAVYVAHIIFDLWVKKDDSKISI
ncbi:protein translocase subunit SecD [Desulfovibrio litoralis]|uniref:Protein translocase subunit SecD n=1 Tax=Desulfovibrio litoralis DSM 11393 TaxID=1121455 RepID=A0A1M7SNK8_9BACT|nr:protein translocase subunit SecD [Desulfovibrio litoralis]SHN60014.1 preprotein translocase subunit SecD [Desulfovibrio litoralis DSM 11393]